MEKEGIVFRIGAREGAGRSMTVSLVDACAVKLVSEDEKVATKSIWVSVRLARYVCHESTTANAEKHMANEDA